MIPPPPTVPRRVGRWLGIAALVAPAAAGGVLVGLAVGDSDDNGSSDSGCPVVQVPVSDHIEGQCIPEARGLLSFFNETSTPPGSHAEGWVSIGELWLDGTNRFCWLNEAGETRCSSSG